MQKQLRQFVIAITAIAVLSVAAPSAFAADSGDNTTNVQKHQTVIGKAVKCLKRAVTFSIKSLGSVGCGSGYDPIDDGYGFVQPIMF